MNRVLRYTTQALLYGAFIITIAYAATAPSYTHVSSDSAVIKLILSHAGQRKEECRQLSDQEKSELAPNMRVTEVCPRERSPVRIEVLIDGELLYQAVIPPGGLQRDGNANAYQRFVVPAGKHTIQVYLNDSIHVDGFNYIKDTEVTLSPLQVLVISFKQESGGFIFN